MLKIFGIRAALLILGATSIAWGRQGGQARAPGPKRATKGVSHSAKELVGRWVIDPKRSAAVPPAAASAAREIIRLSHLDFLPGGRYKDYPGGVEFPGRYEVSGSKVKLTATDGTGGTPDVGEYRAAEGTITFSPGPHRVVYVRASKPKGRARGRR